MLFIKEMWTIQLYFGQFFILLANFFFLNLFYGPQMSIKHLKTTGKKKASVLRKMIIFGRTLWTMYFLLLIYFHHYHIFYCVVNQTDIWRNGNMLFSYCITCTVGLVCVSLFVRCSIKRAETDTPSLLLQLHISFWFFCHLLSLAVRNKRSFTSKINHRPQISVFLSASFCLSVLCLCPPAEPTSFLCLNFFFL